MIGVAIGVVGIIGVATATSTLGRTIGRELTALGADYIRVIPYHDPTQLSVKTRALELDDGWAVLQASTAVAAFNPIYSSKRIVQGNGHLRQATIYGVGDAFQSIHRYQVSVGRFFDRSEQQRHAPVAIVGAELADELGLGRFPVGATLTLGTTPVTVIGVLERVGTSIFNEEYDRALVLPITTVLDLFGSPAREGIILEFKAHAVDAVPVAEQEIGAVLRTRRGLAATQGGGFMLLKQAQLLKSIDSLVLTAGMIGAAIVGLSLLVGGVGIMNIMLVSVRERIVEIGLRKAVGARKRDIVVQFLTEAILLCICGGLLGLAIAMSLIAAVSWLLPQITEISIPPWAVIGALGFSALTGLVFGTYPATQAASLDAIEALRREA